MRAADWSPFTQALVTARPSAAFHLTVIYDSAPAKIAVFVSMNVVMGTSDYCHRR